MGSLTIPASGVVYVDANPLIYSVERHPDFASLLRPLWQAAQARTIEVVSSELVMMEVLTGPLKQGNAPLVAIFEQALTGSDLRLIPITQSILRDAANLRATTRLKTPDALHAATAHQVGCSLFVTNDVDFRGQLRVPLIVLTDLLAP